MTIFEAMKRRDIKTAFSFTRYMDERTYNDIETVVFLTEDDGEKTLGYDVDTTLFIVSSSYRDVQRVFSEVAQMLTILNPMKEVQVIKSERRIRIK